MGRWICQFWWESDFWSSIQTFFGPIFSKKSEFGPSPANPDHNWGHCIYECWNHSYIMNNCWYKYGHHGWNRNKSCNGRINCYGRNSLNDFIYFNDCIFLMTLIAVIAEMAKIALIAQMALLALIAFLITWTCLKGLGCWHRRWFQLCE